MKLSFAVLIMMTQLARADCPANQRATIVFGNGILTDRTTANDTLIKILRPAILQAIGNTIDPSCLDFYLAYDSLFYDVNNNIVNLGNLAPQLIDGLAQRGIDFAANFWQYWDGPSPPSWFAELQQQLVFSVTSTFQPDLLKQETYYSSELASDNNQHTIIVVAHSQGNLYVNQAYSVVTSSGGASRFHIVGVATPATYVAGGGKEFTLNGDFITSIPGSVQGDITNDPPSPCPVSVTLLTLPAAIACHLFDSSYMGVQNGLVQGGDDTRPAIVNAVISAVPTNAPVLVATTSFSGYDYYPCNHNNLTQTISATGNFTLDHIYISGSEFNFGGGSGNYFDLEDAGGDVIYATSMNQFPSLYQNENNPSGSGTITYAPVQVPQTFVMRFIPSGWCNFGVTFNIFGIPNP